MSAERMLHVVEAASDPSAARVVVSMRDVTKVFRVGKTEVAALKGVSMGVREGEFLAITGSSGSGKTTLLNLIGCLDRPTSGRIEVEDMPTQELSSDALARLRAAKLGIIFQTFNLIPVLTVGENAEYPLLLKSPSMTRRERREVVLETLSGLGIAALVDRMPNELSGGECQRAAIARALVTRPRIVLADEPTSNLDSKTGGAILGLMRRLHEQKGMTFIFSTHDARLADLAGRVIELRDGELVADRSG
jgi:putative ABC transport system ATP-binding protein